MPAEEDLPETQHVSPHLDSDRPTNTDFLGFTPYVRGMADYLAHPATTFPLTISVEGEWGAGKTSFMQQLERRLKKRGFATVWFDPWTHRRPESLWAAFALACVKQLARSRSRWILPFLKLRLISKRLKARMLTDIGSKLVYACILIAVLWLWLRGGLGIVWPSFQHLLGGQQVSAPVLEWALKIGPFILAIIPALKELYGVIAGLLEADLKRYIDAPDYTAHQDVLTRLHEDFKAVLDTYSGQKPVVVFVDDLDRCAPEVVAEMMQAINLLMSDDPRMAFIIGLDREMVAAAYAARNEKLLPHLAETSLGTSWGPNGAVGLSFGLSFLEKFITIPFRLPMMEERSVDRLVQSLVPRHSADNRRASFLYRTRLWLTMLGWRRRFWFSEKAETVETGRAEVEEVADYEFTVSATAERRRERLRIELYEDSDTIRAAVAMVAPPFGYNPRRIKQFLNVLRLRAYMASQTGLFDEVADRPWARGHGPITLAQLAKLVAISLKWPGFFRDVQPIPDGMRSLTQVVYGIIREANTVAVMIQRWAENSQLADLLRSGCYDAEGRLIPELVARYGLDAVDLRWFTGIAPQVLRRGGTIFKDRPWNSTQGSLSFWRENKRKLGPVVRAVMRSSAEPDGYYLRLIDEHDDEMWFGGFTAGYGGEGPHGTLDVLLDAGFGPKDELSKLIGSNQSFDIRRSLPQDQRETPDVVIEIMESEGSRPDAQKL